MAAISFPLEEIYQLIKSVMLSNGCDEPNAVALADIMTRAERDANANKIGKTIITWRKAFVLVKSRSAYGNKIVEPTFLPRSKSR